MNSGFIPSKVYADYMNKKSKGTLLTDFSDAVHWYGTFDHTGENTKVGDVSAKISTDSENNTSALRVRNIDLKLSNIKNFLIRFYVEDISAFSNFTVRLSDVDNMSEFFTYTGRRYSGVVEGWNEILIDVDDFTISGGSPTLDIIKTMQFSITKAGGEEHAVVHFDSFYFNYKSKPKVIIQFDDGWETQYTNAFRIMRRLGISGSIGVISNNVGINGYMTLSQMKEMQNYGWDFFNHTKTHSYLSTMTREQIITELSDCRNWLLDNGLIESANYVAYPYGDFDEVVLDVMNELEFDYGRSTGFGYPVSPVIEQHKVLSIIVEETHSPQDLKEFVDRAIYNNETLKIVFHKIEPTVNDSITYSIDDFTEVMEYIAENNDKLNICNTFDWMAEDRLVADKNSFIEVRDNNPIRPMDGRVWINKSTE